MKGTTDFVSGFFGPMAVATRPIGGTKYLDWEKARQLINEHPDSVIYAGLAEDWNNTSGLIYAKGNFYNGYVFGCSCWATPILDIDGEEYECWTYEKTPEGSGKPEWLREGPHLKEEYEFWCKNNEED